MKLIGQNEITSNRVREGVCLSVRDVSVSRPYAEYFL